MEKPVRAIIAAIAALTLIMQPAIGHAGQEKPGSSVSRTEGSAGVSRLTADDAERWLDGLMPFALANGDIAGAVVVIVRDGHVLLQKGYGYADRAARRPADARNTLFRIGSITKLFTWTAVMQLVEQGRLDLDRDINHYLAFKLPARPDGPVTLRMLMTHRAGFEEVFGGMIMADEAALPPLADAVSTWIPKRIFPAGTTPAYSNYGTALAGHIVARAAGVPFDDYVERNILSPLHMDRTSLRQPLPASMRADMSHGYRVASGGPQPFEMIALSPAGAATTTGADMARFMIAHLQGGGTILDRRTAAMMHDNRVTTLPGLNRMALGFYEQNIHGREVIGHGGDTQWFRSHVWLFPREKTGLFIAMNSSGKAGAAATLRTALFEEFADRYFPAGTATKRTGIDKRLAAKHARLIAGTYETSRRPDSSFLKALQPFGQLRVRVDGNGDVTIDGRRGINGAARKWIETEPFLWREVGGNSAFAVQMENGRVQRLAFSENAPHTQFRPVPWHASGAWLVPALLASLLLLLLTLLAWPVGYALRRYYGIAQPSSDRLIRSRRLVKGFAGLAIAVVLGWLSTIAMMLSDFTLMNGGLNWAIRTLQLAGILVFPGLMASALYNIAVTWRGSGWRARLWSASLLAAAALLLLYAAAYHLLTPGSGY